LPIFNGRFKIRTWSCNNNRVHCSFRNIGCLRVLSTSVYQMPRTLVRSSFYPLPWWPIFSSYS
jgi:hypothetical protein